ncbi:SDR family oxidoreductase [Nocardioides jishulii]|uniref:SDR family oxidoreductase n=1 Tax=Nocardioides jishulii TaxID=2575440 RepID=A0A4U2YJR6_9ACTN|nr:SDR family oxidoreductase [Nocardioides jishulii]QCX28071.1 SDR family oxidoreductase [Nocardioides jishulii]TKI60735.1 SDR family oxidoreductase [Nocardioides jishulii]
MTRTHVLTGAGAGIGAALAQHLSDRGDRLVLLVRSSQRADEVSAVLGAEHRYEVVDLADAPAVLETGRRLAVELGSVDSLVHCAGVVDLARVADLEPDAWRHQLDVNLTAPAMLTAGLLPALRGGGSTVVFVNSTSGLAANPDWSAYAASKHGLRALAESLRTEEAPHGLRVTSVFPSRTGTAMQARVHTQEGKEYRPEAWMSAESVASSIVHVLDLPADTTLTDLTLRTSPSPT